MDLRSDATTASASLLLHAEEIAISRRRVEGDTVRVSTVTRSTEKLVEEALMHERIEVEHVAVGRQVEAVPAVREEGDVTIIPVVEEILFVEKRLILKQEIRIRRVQVPDVHRQVVTLREQDVVVERTRPGAKPGSSAIEVAPASADQALKQE